MAVQRILVSSSRALEVTNIRETIYRQIAAYLEQEMGWAKGYPKGAFLWQEEAIAFFKGAQPGFAVLRTATFFSELRQANGLTPIVAIESPDLVSPQLHLVVLNPAWSSIEQSRQNTLDHPGRSPATFLK